MSNVFVITAEGARNLCDSIESTRVRDDIYNGIRSVAINGETEYSYGIYKVSKKLTEDLVRELKSRGFEVELQYNLQVGGEREEYPHHILIKW